MDAQNLVWKENKRFPLDDLEIVREAFGEYAGHIRAWLTVEVYELREGTLDYRYPHIIFCRFEYGDGDMVGEIIERRRGIVDMVRQDAIREAIAVMDELARTCFATCEEYIRGDVADGRYAEEEGDHD